MSKWCETLRALVHRHKMEKVAHWCDKECSIILVEYKCTDCEHEAWDFVYFDDARCKVLKRLPVEVTAIDAPKLVKCGEPVCEQLDKKTTAKIKQQRRSTDFGGHVDSKTKAPASAKEKRK